MNRNTAAFAPTLIFSIATLFIGSRAFAQEAPTEPPAEEPPSAPTEAKESPMPDLPAPPPREITRSKFQLAGRATYALPLGRMSGAAGDEINQSLGGQVPFTIDLGWWLTPRLLVGGFASLAVGGASGRLERHCEESNVRCPTTSGRLGLQIAYHFAPTRSADPWIGYGFGVESTSLHVHREDGHDQASAFGLDFARLSAGLDVPLARRAWIGPVFDFSVGQYVYSRAQAALDPTASGGAINDRAMHYWVGLGVKFTVDP